MKILSSAVQFSVQHQAAEQHEVRESLRVWHTTTQPAAPAPHSPAECDEQAPLFSADPADLQLVLLQMLIERLTGRKMKLADVQGLLDASASVPDLADPGPATAAPARPDWGAIYERHEVHSESEQMQFAATGVVRTADGKEIQLALSLTMSREFMSRNDLELRAGAAALKDPLVLNFGGNAAQLTDRTFRFDLNADGGSEEVALLAATSAYLALDRNEDGKINDGSELFGTRSGDGFADLAAFDQDHNGWIDEADPVFSRLKLWFPGMDGGSLASLGDRNVGALYLGAVASPFELKEGEELNGQVRSTGLYLEEDGTAGTMQQVDLKV